MFLPRFIFRNGWFTCSALVWTFLCWLFLPEEKIVTFFSHPEACWRSFQYHRLTDANVWFPLSCALCKGTKAGAFVPALPNRVGGDLLSWRMATLFHWESSYLILHTPGWTQAAFIWVTRSQFYATFIAGLAARDRKGFPRKPQV